MREVRKHYVSTSDRRINTPAGTNASASGNTAAHASEIDAAVSDIAKWRHLPALRNHLRGRHKILWTMRYSYRNFSARLAPAKTRGGLLPQLRHQLSGGHKVLRPLWQTDSLLSELELSFNLCP